MWPQRSWITRRPCLTRPLPLAWSAPVVALVVLTLTGPAGAQTPRPAFPVTDEEVDALVLSGNTLYIGGRFTHVGPATGCGVPLATATGTPVVGFPMVDGPVYAAVPDGSGGWYIGGDFDVVGDSARANLARVRADNSVAAWNAPTDGPVRALALGASTLYVGGEFYKIGSEWISNLAAVDVTTASVNASWNPGCGGRVNALALDGSTLYVGGEFFAIGVESRGGVGAVDAGTGVVTAWNPGAPGSDVRAIVVSGTTVYVGGMFTDMGGQPRSSLAALDATTGLATSFVANTSYVYALAVSGTTLYVGGEFGMLSGAVRSRLGAVDATTGTASDWDPAAGASVLSLAVNAGGIYAGGRFPTMGGRLRYGLAGFSGGAIGVTDLPAAVEVALLHPNTPNPFRGSTLIRFALPSAGRVSLTVFDPAGREVARLLRDVPCEAGVHAVPFDGRRLPSGVYLCQLRVGGRTDMRTMVHLRD